MHVRRIRVVLLLGVVAVLGLVGALLMRGQPPTRSSHPQHVAPDAVIADVHRFPSGPSLSSPESGARLRRTSIVVETNVAESTVTLQLWHRVGAPEYSTEQQRADLAGRAEFSIAPDPTKYWSILATARAEGYERRTAIVQDGYAKIYLARGEAIRGVVVDTAGIPVRHADVYLAGVQDRTVSNEQGVFTLYTRSSAREEVRVIHPHFRMAIVATGVPAINLRVVLHRGMEISGTVLFAGGAPAEGVAVSGPGPDRTTTDADGRYTIRGLAPGLHELTCDDLDVGITAVAGAEDADFVLDRHVVRVRIMDEHRAPLRGAAVSILQSPPGWLPNRTENENPPTDGVANEELKQTVQDLAVTPGNRVTALAYAPGRRSAVVEMETPRGKPRLVTVQATLERVTELSSLRFTIRFDKEPKPKVYVFLTVGAVELNVHDTYVSLDEHGVGVMEGLLPGTYLVRVARDPSCMAVLERRVVARAGEQVKVEGALPARGFAIVDATPTSANTLEDAVLFLRNREGRVVGSRLVAMSTDHRRYRTAMTFAQGEYYASLLRYGSALSRGRIGIGTGRDPVLRLAGD